jgi:hypothetical protein
MGFNGPRLAAQETQPVRIRAFLALDADSHLWGLDQNATRIEFLLQMIAPNSGAVHVQAIPQAQITPAGLTGYFDALNDVKPTDVLIFSPPNLRPAQEPRRNEATSVFIRVTPASSFRCRQPGENR